MFHCVKKYNITFSKVSLMLATNFTIQSKKNTQQNETYFPKADIDNICGYNRKI